MPVPFLITILTLRIGAETPLQLPSDGGEVQQGETPLSFRVGGHSDVL